MSLSIRLPAPDDVDAALGALARLLAQHVPPEAVCWDDGTPRQAGLFDDALSDRGVNGSLFDDGMPGNDAPAGVQANAQPGAGPAPALGLGDAAQALLRQALLHADGGRFALAHRYAAHLRAQPAAWHDRLHPERLKLERMAREVGREIHKMHAFVRFRPVADAAEAANAANGGDGWSGGNAAIRHVAWFEPAHPVVRAAAPFFQRRFAAMRWAILTPLGSVQWTPSTPGQRSALQFGPPARRDDAPPADAGEALWLAYYRSTFNPARANPAMMRREMPQRYWPNLPEAALIAPLLRDAAPRTGAMLGHAADTTRRLPGLRPKPRR